MAVCHVAMISMSLLLILSVRSEPHGLPQSEPSDHGVGSQGQLTVSPAMLNFFKGTEPNVELPEAIDPAGIARASHVTPQSREESVSDSSGGERRKKGAVVAGVICGVAGLVLIAAAVAVYKKRSAPGVGQTEEKLGWWRRRGSEATLGSP